MLIVSIPFHYSSMQWRVVFDKNATHLLWLIRIEFRAENYICCISCEEINNVAEVAQDDSPVGASIPLEETFFFVEQNHLLPLPSLRR